MKKKKEFVFNTKRISLKAVSINCLGLFESYNYREDNSNNNYNLHLLLGYSPVTYNTSWMI